MPVYFQAVQGASSIGSGVDMLPIVIVCPVTAMITGASVQVVNRYRPQNYLGWVMMLIGFGLLSSLTEHSSRALYIGLQVPASIGVGIVWISTLYEMY